MIPQAQDPLWNRILTGAATPDGLSLATRMLLARLRRRVLQEPSVLAEAIADLRSYYIGNRYVLPELAAF